MTKQDFFELKVSREEYRLLKIIRSEEYAVFEVIKSKGKMQRIKMSKNILLNAKLDVVESK